MGRPDGRGRSSWVYLGLSLVLAVVATACTAPAPVTPAAGRMAVGPGTDAQIALGRYLVISHACGGCHGGRDGDPAAKGWLAGEQRPDQEFKIGPFTTHSRNITPDNATGIGRFSDRQIFNSLRYGLRPGETPDVEITSTTPGEGNFPLRPKYLAVPMPWPSWRHMPDHELWAMVAYLKRGVKPVSNRVADSDGPPDFWASEYTVAKIGPWPAPAYPTANETGR